MFYEYINSYDVCAINLVPVAIAREWANEFPEVFRNRISHFQHFVQNGKHIGLRFEKGAYINCRSSQAPSDGNQYVVGYNKCEYVIDYQDLQWWRRPNLAGFEDLL